NMALMAFSESKEFQQPDFKGYGPKSVCVDTSNEVKKTSDTPLVDELVVNYNYTTNRTHPNAQRNMVPRAVLMKTGLKPFNTAKTISRSLIEDMLPLVEESKEERSLVKMCDKKNCVLFTDIACFVLSHDIKLPDESQI
ncbi:hypothetical protein Tco_1152477, partial [Tanacetum coccineum]